MKLQTLSETVSAVTPFAYAGAVRVGVTDAIVLLREQVLARVPGEIAASVAEFLRSPAGEGILRLSLAGALATIPAAERAQVVNDVRDELLASAFASGFTAVQDAAQFAVAQLAAKGE
jgi:hypothetical protein